MAFLSGDYGAPSDLASFQAIIQSLLDPNADAARRHGRLRTGLPGSGGPTGFPAPDPTPLPAAAPVTAAPGPSAAPADLPTGFGDIPGVSSVPAGGAPSAPSGSGSQLSSYLKNLSLMAGPDPYAPRPGETPEEAHTRVTQAYKDKYFHRSPLQLLMDWTAPLLQATGAGLMSGGGPGSQRLFLGNLLGGLSNTVGRELARPQLTQQAAEQGIAAQRAKQLADAAEVIKATQGNYTGSPIQAVDAPDGSGKQALYNILTNEFVKTRDGNLVYHPAKPETQTPHTVVIAGKVMQYNDRTGKYDIEVGKSPPTAASAGEIRTWTDKQGVEHAYERDPLTGAETEHLVPNPDPSGPRYIPYASYPKPAKPTASERTDNLNSDAVKTAQDLIDYGDAQLRGQGKDPTKETLDSRYNAANEALNKLLRRPSSTDAMRANADRVRRAIHNALGRKGPVPGTDINAEAARIITEGASGAAAPEQPATEP